MSDEDAAKGDHVFHYEDGLPVFDARLKAVERKQGEEESRYKQEQITIDRRMMQFTGALVICSILSGLVSGYQAHVAKLNASAASDNAAAAKAQAEAAKIQAQAARQQVTEMQKGGTDTHILATAAEAQAVASKHQSVSTGTLAENARETLAQTQSSFQDDQRAWVGIGEARITQFQEGKPIKIEISVINSGKTPALFVEAATSRKLATSPLIVLVPRDLIGMKFEPATSIPPQGHYSLAADFPDAVSLVRAKIQYMYVFGEFRYEDIYKRIHRTEYCTFIKDPDSTNLAFCPVHNNMN